MKRSADHSTTTFGLSMPHQESDINVTPTSHGPAAAILLILLMVYGSRAQTPGVRSTWRLNFCVLGMKLASYHLSGAYSFEVIPRFFENLCTSRIWLLVLFC